MQVFVDQFCILIVGRN